MTTGVGAGKGGAGEGAAARAGAAAGATGAGAAWEARITDHPILRYPQARQVVFTFEGREVSGLEGEPIAAALLAAGIRAFRHSTNLGRPRGLLCAIGNCSSCLMVVDGRPNVRVGVEKLR